MDIATAFSRTMKTCISWQKYFERTISICVLALKRLALLNAKDKMLKLNLRVPIYVLWFHFILGLNFIFLCFKLIIIHYHTKT